MLSKLSGQNIALIIIAVSVLLAVVWYFTLYSNTLAESDGVRTEIVALNEKKQVGERARTNVISLCQVVTDLERQKAEFLRALPSNEQFSSLLNTLRVQASAGGGRLNSVSRALGAAGGAVPAGVKSITLSMNLEATFDGIRTLLASFEQQQRFLKVETVSLSPGATSSDPTAQLSNPLLTSSMSMTAYIYDNPNRGAAATPINPVCQSTPATEVPK
jgi:type IV pilus assembly protein PilO